jgi:hypothetical protein
MNLCGLVTKFYFHVSVSDFNIFRSLADRSWEYINCSKIHECGNWETEHCNSVLEKNEVAQFHFLKYINQNQTFILDSHRTFIYSVLLLSHMALSFANLKSTCQQADKTTLPYKSQPNTDNIDYGFLVEYVKLSIIGPALLIP